MGIQVTTNMETGEQEVKELASSSGGTHSSEDYNPYGVTARGERGYVVAQTPDQLSDTDIVKFEGMDLTVQQAKEYGVLDQIFGKAASEAEGAPQASEASSAETTESAPSDPSEASTVSNLQAALDAGEISAEEATLYDTVNAEIQLSGMEPQAALEALDAIHRGENPEDITGDQRSMLDRINSEVTRASTKAAHSELGQEAFQQLQAWAGMSSEVNEALRGFAAKRAMGDRSGGTWGAFYQEVSDFMAGR